MQRFWKRLRKKPSIETRIKGYRQVGIAYACFACFVLGLSFLNFYTMIQLYKAEPPAIEEIINAWHSVVFLAGVSAVSGFFAFLGLLDLILGLFCYSQSLELRIKELEKQVVIEAHGMREKKESS